MAISDHSDAFDTLILTGPKSREILSLLTDADLAAGWLTHQKALVAGQEAFLIRVSYAGELGWEIHAKNANMASIYDALHQVGQPLGLKPFGMFALDSLRLEKGYRTWKGDLSTDYSLLEGRLDRFVKLDKNVDFPGREALLKQKTEGLKKRFVTLVVEGCSFDAPYMSTLWYNDEVVGETTSGGWGHRIDKSIALGMLRIDLVDPGTKITVEIFGKHYDATVHADEPLWDPKNERIRA